MKDRYQDRFAARTGVEQSRSPPLGHVGQDGQARRQHAGTALPHPEFTGPAWSAAGRPRPVGATLEEETPTCYVEPQYISAWRWQPW